MVYWMFKLTKSEKEQICKRFAEYMPKMRKALMLTQEKLGELCGYSRIRISNIETGRESLSWHQLMALALVFILNEKSKQIINDENVLNDKFFDYIIKNKTR